MPTSREYQQTVVARNRVELTLILEVEHTRPMNQAMQLAEVMKEVASALRVVDTTARYIYDNTHLDKVEFGTKVSLLPLTLKPVPEELPTEE